MSTEVKIPTVGESITTGTLSQWHVASGEAVAAGQTLFSLETDKVTQEIEADESGVIELLVEAGTEVEIGQVVARIGVATGADNAAQSAQPEAAASDVATTDSSQNHGQAEAQASPEGQAPPAQEEYLDAPALAAASGQPQQPDGEGASQQTQQQVVAEGDAAASQLPSGAAQSVEVKVPPVGESVSTGTLSSWLVADGHQVSAGQPVFALETDKITQEVEAEASGILRHGVGEGTEVAIGQAVGSIEVGAGSPAPLTTVAPIDKPQAQGGIPADKPAPSADPPQRVREALALSAERLKAQKDGAASVSSPSKPVASATPAAAAAAKSPSASSASPEAASAGGTGAEESRVTRRKMSQLRRKIARHLVNAQQTAAILTTFNEVDMGAVMGLRKELQDGFVARHGVKLGFMSFFVKAVVEALKAVPSVNARIEGEEIVENHFYDIGCAIGTEKGLVVPVLRDCDQKSFAQIEKDILDYAAKAKEGKLGLADLQGGVFTISNGGVYGSLLSTPILNPPQSGILGMHTIQERPVAVKGQVVIRPMMYLALSYDHRLVDGKEAVTFLLRIKECIERPTRLLVGA